MANETSGRRCARCNKPVEQNQRITVNGNHKFPCDPEAREVIAR